MQSLRHLVLVGGLALLASCSSLESFQVSVMRPAPVDLGQHQLVAIDRFTGDGCDCLADEFAAALEATKNPLTGSADFEVVDRRDVDRMIDDMRRYPNAKLGEDPNSAIAKWKRASILLKGTLHVHSAQESVDSEDFVDPKTGPHTRFVRRVSAQVAVTVEALGDAGRTSIDRVKFSENAGGSTQAIDEQPHAIDHKALLAAARRKIIARYLRRVTPHQAWARVQLYKKSDLPQLAVGNGFARTGDWDEALSSYRSASEAAQGELAELAYMAQYNMGVALLYLNRFDESRAALKRAYALEQDQMILKQLTAVGQREDDARRLEEQSRRASAQPGR